MGRAIGQVNVSASKLAEFRIPAAPLDEQIAIVSVLDAHRAAIAEAASDVKGQIDELGRLDGALLRSAFSGAL